jgi:hypothetical protein
MQFKGEHPESLKFNCLRFEVYPIEKPCIPDKPPTPGLRKIQKPDV